MAVKRRTIWMSDEDWDAVQAEAKRRDLTPSTYIRGATVINLGVAQFLDAARPFVEFRPAPKPGRK